MHNFSCFRPTCCQAHKDSHPRIFFCAKYVVVWLCSVLVCFLRVTKQTCSLLVAAFPIWVWFLLLSLPPYFLFQVLCSFEIYVPFYELKGFLTSPSSILSPFPLFQETFLFTAFYTHSSVNVFLSSLHVWLLSFFLTFEKYSYKNLMFVLITI